MSICARCHQYNCNSLCGLGACKTCNMYSCRGNCSTRMGQRLPSVRIRCNVCGEEYSGIHSPFMCNMKEREMEKRRMKR